MTVDRALAPRLELVEEMSGHAVADPYRRLEDPADPRTQAWAAEQEQALRAERESWPATEAFRTRLGELIAAGMVSAPVWRGARQFFMRRTADQEHAVLLTVDPDGT